MKIYLFIPSRIYGGAERQMALLAREIFFSGADVTVIDSPNRVVADMLSDEPDIRILEYSDSKKLLIKDSLIISQASYAFCIDKMLDLENCEVRFWFMHPISLPHMFICLRLKLLGKILKALLSPLYKDKIFKLKEWFYYQVPDSKNTLSDFYNIALTNNITYALLDHNLDTPQKEISDQFSRNIFWLGRLDNSSKLFFLKKLIKDFTEARSKLDLSTLNIIGSGQGQKELERYVRKLGIERSVIFHGEQSYDRLTFLLRDSLILFAQGTSVYEGVRASIPVVVADFFMNQELADNSRYKLYSSFEDLTLGKLVDSEHQLDALGSSSLIDLIELAQLKEERRNIVKSQSLKMKRAIKQGKDGCHSLYSSPLIVNEDFRIISCIDWSFFKFRNFWIKVTNRKN